MRIFAVTSLAILTLSPAARADYPTEQAKLKLGRIQRAIDAFSKPAWFDGRTIAAGTSAAAVDNHTRRCDEALRTFTTLWPEIDAKIQQTEEGRTAQRRYTELAPVCKALADAGAVHQRALAAAESQAAAQVAAEQAEDARRHAFTKDIPPIANKFLVNFKQAFDPTLTSYESTDYSEDAYRDAKAGYEALLPVCKKHAPLSNPGKDQHNIVHRPADACAMAEQGAAVVQKRRELAVTSVIERDIDWSILRLARGFMANQPKAMPELLQLVVFDRNAFVELWTKEYAPTMTKAGGTLKPDAFDAAFAMNDQMKAKLDTDVENNKLELPKFHDAGAEKAAAAFFTKAVKGATVRTSATAHKVWARFDDKTWVGSDATYDYYRVNAGKTSYMSGFIVLEVAGRPYCQVREWTAFRVLRGPIKVVANEATDNGLFVKCP